MSDTVDVQINKAKFLNQVADITAKIGTAVDDLIMLTDSNVKYFNDSDTASIRNSIDGITTAVSLVLIDTISVVAPEELDNIKPSCSFSKACRPDEYHYTYDEDILSLLPEVAKDMVRLLGINQAMNLFKAFGGSTFPIGKGVKYLGGSRAKALQSVLTVEEITRLQDNFQGEIIYLPRCNRLLREVRNRQFLKEFAEMRQQGTSALMAMMRLCPKHGFSDRYGWELLKNERESQASL